MKLKALLFYSIPLMILGGCQKINNEKSPNTNLSVVLDGTYSGTFILKPNSLGEPYNFAITFTSGQFNSLTGTNLITAGKGSYLIDGNSVSFTNTEKFPDNGSSLNTVAVLNATYVYSAKGDSVFLTKTDVENNVTSYKMKKK